MTDLRETVLATVTLADGYVSDTSRFKLDEESPYGGYYSLAQDDIPAGVYVCMVALKAVGGKFPCTLSFYLEDNFDVLVVGDLNTSLDDGEMAVTAQLVTIKSPTALLQPPEPYPYGNPGYVCIQTDYPAKTYATVKMAKLIDL